MELSELASILGAAGMVAAGMMVVKERSLVYASVYLAVVAVFNAGLMALLGYTMVAAFQVVVYVGAAVLFIIIAVTLMGEPVRREPRSVPYAVLVFALGLISFTALLLRVASEIQPPPKATVTLSEVLDMFQSVYLVPVILAFVALAAVLIEAAVLARRESEGDKEVAG